MNKTLLVARWEFMRNFKWKQELVGYLLMLVIYAAIFAVQTWSQVSTQSTVKLAVMGQLVSQLDRKFQLQNVTQSSDQQQIFKLISEQGLDGVLDIKAPDEYVLYARQQSPWQALLEKNLADDQQRLLLQEMNISKEQFEKLQNPIQLTFVNQAKSIVGSSLKMLGLLAAILSAMAVFSSFGLCLTSVTQEKQHRITEQLLTCISHQQWVDGKALGLCLSSLKSLFSTTLLMALIFTGISVFTQSSEFRVDVSFSVLAQIFLFCVLGVFFWNYVYVGFAATIDDPNHSGKTGLMMLPLLPVMMVFMVMDAPNGQVAKVLSMFPLTSISFMPMRVASMDVPLWHIALSLVFLLVGIYYVRMFATRIFRANITLFGKEPNWTEIWRSMLKANKHS